MNSKHSLILALMLGFAPRVQVSDRNTQAPSILATSGHHPTLPAAGIAQGSDLMVLSARVYWGEVGGSGSAACCGASLGKLFPGSYSLTAILTDAGGLTETKTIPFSVAPLSVPDSGTVTLDGVRDSADYANAPSVNRPLTDGSSATAGFPHHGSPCMFTSTACPSNLTESERACCSI